MGSRLGGLRRAVAAVVACAVVASLLVLEVLPPGPDPAVAAFGSSQALTSRTAYGPNEAIYASGNVTFMTGCKDPGRPPGIDDIFQPWADLYIVPTGSVALGSALVDIAGAPNVIFGGFAGGFVEELIGFTGPGGTIPAGVYDIIIDDCQDGVFDSTDSLMSEAFRVTIPLGTEPVAVGGALKARAASLAGDYAKLALAWELMLEAISNTKVAGAVSINALSDMSIAIFQAQAQTVLPDPRAAMSGALVQLGRANKGLAADPPDPAFHAHAPVELPAAVGPAPTGGLVETLLVDSARSAGVDAALLAALVTAVERHQGAAQVGNGDWMAAHARDAIALIDLIEARATTTTSLLTAVRTEYGRIETTANAVRSWYTQLVDRPVAYLQTGGNAALVQRDSQNRGLSAAEVEEVLHELLELQEAAPLAQGTRMQQVVDGVVAATAAQVAELAPLRADLVGTLDGLAAEGRDGPRPVADAGGPYVAATGTPVTLDASASAPSSGSVPLVSYEWDLDLNGTFDDATGPVVEHTLALAGSTVVGVRVTDQAGATDVAYAAVDVTVGDLPPVITSFTSTPAPTPASSSVVLVDRDAPFTLGITAEDPEGQPVTVAWYRDGVPAGSDTTLAGPALGDYGTVRYEAAVSDPAGNLAVQTFVVTAFGPDADGDLWRVPADCDDTNNLIHPARVEVYGNGVDDDCNPETSDDPGTILPPVITGSSLITNTAQPNSTWPTGWQVGDGVLLNVNWGHTTHRHLDPFAWTVDWGDGTVTSGTVVAQSLGTYFQDTQIPASHVYRTGGYKHVTACITGPLLDVPDYVPHQTCRTSAINAFNAMLPAPPAVHPVNLRDWEVFDITQPIGPDPGGIVGDWQVTPDGSSTINRTNQNYPSLLVSDFVLDTTDGPARIAVDLGTANTGDDDTMGFALGIPSDAGELSSPTADWIAVQLKGHYAGLGVLSSGHCLHSPGSRPTPTFTEPHPNQLLRHRGVGHVHEYFYGVTLAMEPADDVWATCLDDAGAERLATALLPAPLGQSPSGIHKYLRPPEQLTTQGWQRTRPYRLEVEYSPSEIVVWVDGVELFSATAPLDDPFPQGRVALLTQSQPGVRFVGHHQAPREAAVQGEARDFTVTFADPGEEGQYSAVVEWGDGTPAAIGEIAAIGGRPGFFTVTAEHTYLRAGRHWAEVCVTDETDDQVGCGSVEVTVANAVPIVDAGPDTLAGGEVTLEGVTYRDPGIHDTHTATIDWGDGTPIEAVVPIATASGAGIIEAAPHTYAGPGTYTVTVCVTDQLEAEGCDTREVEVRTDRTAPLAAHITDGPAAPEGSPVDIGVAFTDTLPGAAHRVVIDWGDGTVEDLADVRAGSGTVIDEDDEPVFATFGSGWAARAYADDGSYTVTATVCDTTVDCDDPGAPSPGWATIQTVVTVTDVPPSVAASWAVTDDEVALSAVVTDPGALDTHTATIDWGDGTVETGVPVLGGPGGGTVEATHRYGATGAYDVEVCVTDDDIEDAEPGCDGTEVAITTVSLGVLEVTLDPVDPTDEGTPVTFTGTYQLPDGHDGEGVEVHLTPAPGATAVPATVDPAAGTFTAGYVYPDDGTFTATAQACAPAATCGTDTVEVVVANVAPTVDAGEDRRTDGTLVLDGVTFTDPGTDDTHTATVDWGDGSPVEAATVVPTPTGGIVTGSHDYLEGGPYDVEVCVTDDDGGIHCDGFTVLVFDWSRFEVGIDPVTPIDEGGTATVSFTISGPEEAEPDVVVRWGDGSDPTSVTVSFEDGAATASATHPYLDDGTYTATVEACDIDGCGTATAIVEVANVAPVITDLDVTVDEDAPGTVDLTAAFTDPGVLDAHAATVDWGEGTTTSAQVDGRAVTASYGYTQVGTYTVELCITDGSDDPAGCQAVPVVIDQVPYVAPSIVLQAPAGPIDEGSELTLHGEVAAPDAPEAAQLVIDWGDGSTTTETVTPGPFTRTHTYADDGTYTITATVDDGIEEDTTTLHGVTVRNVAPLVEVRTDIDGLDAAVEVELTDPGVHDLLAATVDWGDGSIGDIDLGPSTAAGASAASVQAAAAAVAGTATHRYAAAGTYTVEVCGRDDDGGRTCVASTVTALAAPSGPPPVDDGPPSSQPPPPDQPPAGAAPLPLPPPSVGGTSATPELPRTGTTTASPLQVAAWLLLAGVLLLGASRHAAQRRPSRSAHRSE